ncbi:MAG: hypothetical protein IPJ76_05115 [Flavobacteriales bacterium]|nr:MAG: hypothetical protein IPJ76_05115 [Flavobacteriales bacterium]
MEAKRNTVAFAAVMSAVLCVAQLPNTVYDAQSYTTAQVEAWGVDLNAPVGVLPGGAGVSATGGATYTIPIAVPPGTNGVAPQLAITYSSQAGDGQLGMGWGISGLSSIAMVNRDMHNSTLVAPMQFSPDDQYELDGLSLVPINGGAQGADGTIYDTEVAQYAEVVSHGPQPELGPYYFTVVTKDGLRYWYGEGDASVRANGNWPVEWKMNKWMDLNGNYVNYVYETDPVDDETYLDRIEYTGNDAANLAPYNHIEFVYSQRDDRTQTWVNGCRFWRTRLLDAIKVYAEGQHVRTYELRYAQRHLGRSFLNSVTVSNAGETEWMHPTIFKYGDIDVVHDVDQYAINDAQVKYFTGDFDGNGMSDVVRVYYDNVDLTPNNNWWDISYEEVQHSFDVYMNGSTTSTHFVDLGALIGTSNAI